MRSNPTESGTPLVCYKIIQQRLFTYSTKHHNGENVYASNRFILVQSIQSYDLVNPVSSAYFKLEHSPNLQPVAEHVMLSRIGRSSTVKKEDSGEHFQSECLWEVPSQLHL